MELPDEVNAKCLLLGIKLVLLPGMERWVVIRDDGKILRDQARSPGQKHAPSKYYFATRISAVKVAAEMLDGKHEGHWY